MKSKQIIKWSMALLIFVTAVTLGTIAYQRMQVEKNNNRVEMLTEYQEIKRLAALSEMSEMQWLVAFKDMGINAIAISEETLLQYCSTKGISFRVATQLLNDGDIQNIYPPQVVEQLQRVNPNSLMLEMTEQAENDFIVNGLNYYKGIHFWSAEIDEKYYIIIEQTKDELLFVDSSDMYNAAGKKIGTNKTIFGTEALNMPIGFDPEKVEIIQASGLKLMLRPNNYVLDPLNAWKLYLSELEKYDMGNQLIMFNGDSVVGSGTETNEYIWDLKEFLDDRGYQIGLVETGEGRDYAKINGLEPIVTALPKNYFVRVFNVWDYIAKRYQYYSYYKGGEEIGNTIYRAVTERNIRAIYFRPFIRANGGYVTNVEDYANMFEDLEVRLAKHGYHYGEATTFEDFSLPLMIKMLLSFELILFGLFFFNYLFSWLKLKVNLVLGVLAAVGVAAAHYVMPNMSINLTALGAAIIFSSLSVTFYFKNALLNPKGENLLHAIKVLVVSCMISLTGALFIASIMADTQYFLELKTFVGVKISLLAPIAAVILIVAYFYIKEVVQEKKGYFVKELIGTGRNFLNTNIKIKYAIILGIIGMIGYVYLARSGNESNLQPMTIELMFRNFLEDVLVARPRTKEFMMSFPAIMVGAYYAGLPFLKKDRIIKYTYALAFALMAVIGQSSITNTFSHIRTPLYISLARVSYSVVFGIIIGTVAIYILKLFGMICKRIWSYFEGKMTDSELR